ncbi:MAG: hypothetical protein DRZ76_03235, partial [Candidatus Nealsonbacteria bacterium]
MCGNGVIDQGEECDNGDENTDEPDLNCYGQLTYCTMACSEMTINCNAYCGDSAINGEETCDGADLGGKTCESILGAGYSGTLACLPDCSDYDVSNCIAPPTCSDNDGDGYGVCPNCGTANGCANEGDDCDDSNSQIWQNLQGYIDADNDGYGVGNILEICSGESLPQGYSSAGGDCNDNNEFIFPDNTNNFCDCDSGDGYSQGTETETAYCSDTLDNDCDNLIDCNDNDCSTEPSCIEACESVISCADYSTFFNCISDICLIENCIWSEESCIANPGGTIFSVSPTSSTINSGESIVLSISIADITDLYGLQFDINYDSGILEYVSITEGDFLGSDGANTFDIIDSSTPGKVTYALTRLKTEGVPTSEQGVSGTGTIAQITFSGINPGVSPLSFSNTELYDPNLVAISHTPSDGMISVEEEISGSAFDAVVNFVANVAQAVVNFFVPEKAEEEQVGEEQAKTAESSPEAESSKEQETKISEEPEESIPQESIASNETLKCTPESEETTCGSWICGVRNNNCGQEVSCGVCEEGFSCQNGQCIVIKTTAQQLPGVNLLNNNYGTLDSITATSSLGGEERVQKLRDNHLTGYSGETWLSSTGQNTNQNITIKFTKAYEFDIIEIFTGYISLIDTSSPKNTNIYVSDDGINWEKIKTLVLFGSAPQSRTFDIISLEPQIKKYLRIEFIDTWGDSTKMTIGEIRVYKNTDNLASLSSTNIYTNAHQLYNNKPISKTADRNYFDGWTTDDISNVNISWEFSKARTFNSLEWHGGASNNFPKEYSLQVSDDGEAWQEISSGAFEGGSPYYAEKIEFPEQKAKYLRLHIKN